MEIWDVGDGTFAEEFTGIERAGPRERLCALKELKPYVWPLEAQAILSRAPHAYMSF